MRRSCGNHVRVRVVVVLEDEARQVDRDRPGVVELDPIAGYAAARFDFVDAHGAGCSRSPCPWSTLAFVRNAPVAVGAAAVGRRRVRRPRVRIDERASRVE